MPPKRRARDDDEAPNVPANAAKAAPVDALIFTNAGAKRKFTVDRLFSERLGDGLGRLMASHVRWDDLRASLASRTAASPVWFIRAGDEEVGVDTGSMNPDVVRVQYVAVAEAPVPTLAPRVFVIREHRAFADDEDCQPEKVCRFADHGFGWLEVLANDGSSINTYLLVSVAERDELLAEAISFGFGAKPAAAAVAADAAAPTPVAASAAPVAAPAPAPAPFAAGFGGGSGATASFAAGFGGGFGSAAALSTGAAPAASSSAPSFGGFGTSTAASTFATGFGNFGNAAAAATGSQQASVVAPFAGFGSFTATATAPTAVTSATTTAAAVPPSGAPAVSGLPRRGMDVDVVLYDAASLRDMKKNTAQGSRIVRRDIALADGTKWDKLVMQNDLHDRVPAVVQESIEKSFTKSNARMREFAKWRDECPEVEPKLIEPLDAMQKRVLGDAMKEDSKTMERLGKYRVELMAELAKIVAVRKAEVERELAILDETAADLNKGNLLPRDKWRVLKFHPRNDLVKFRPHGKARSLTGPGRKVDVCVPPEYVSAGAMAFRKA